MLLEILRRPPGGASRWAVYDYAPAGPADTVATALTRLNETLADPIRWDCSCLQKRCGACAMVVNGRPALACDTRLSEQKAPIRIEPLRKFPVVADLIVDRSVLFDTLREMKVWLSAGADMDQAAAEAGYESSCCLQCGCCLEVCPNFVPGGTFAGMAGAAPLSRLLSELPAGALAELSETYRRRAYDGCGKSLACRNVCPAGIDLESLMVNSNAVAVWKRLPRRRHG